MIKNVGEIAGVLNTHNAKEWSSNYGKIVDHGGIGGLTEVGSALNVYGEKVENTGVSVPGIDGKKTFGDVLADA
ncbi:MAG: hypothetical protein HQK53_15380, partial [Oligoflexia bacterium]|nr:hypothetical protein [Oligoflexia bacterium]